MNNTSFHRPYEGKGILHCLLLNSHASRFSEEVPDLWFAAVSSAFCGRFEARTTNQDEGSLRRRDGGGGDQLTFEEG